MCSGTHHPGTTQIQGARLIEDTNSVQIKKNITNFFCQAHSLQQLSANKADVLEQQQILALHNHCMELQPLFSRQVFISTKRSILCRKETDVCSHSSVQRLKGNGVIVQQMLSSSF